MSWHPIQFWLVLSFGVVGLIQLFQGPGPTSVNRVFPGWVQITLAVLILGGAVVCIAGVVWRDIATGLYFEAAGLIGIGFALATYAVTIISTVPQWWATISAAFTIGLTLGVWSRCIQIGWALLRAERIARHIRLTGEK